MAIFPIWGAIAGHIINAQNNKSSEPAIEYSKITREPTRKDWLIGTLIMVIPAVIIWGLFILIMYLENP